MVKFREYISLIRQIPQFNKSHVIKANLLGYCLQIFAFLHQVENILEFAAKVEFY